MYLNEKKKTDGEHSRNLPAKRRLIQTNKTHCLYPTQRMQDVLQIHLLGATFDSK